MKEKEFVSVDQQVKGQQQDQQPGIEKDMQPLPVVAYETAGSGRLKGKKALITGGDSGIGRAVAVAFAKEGADVAICYLDEREQADAEETLALLDACGVRTYAEQIDISVAENSEPLIRRVQQQLGGLNIVVNNAGKQFPQESLMDITNEQLHTTFETNVFGLFYVTKAALPYLTEGDVIINTSSITAYNGSPELIDYSATKGAITAFTRSLALNLVDQGIRVNAVAPGPIWTPLIPSTFDAEKVAHHGEDTPMKRRGQPAEVAGAFVFLASQESSYMTGQTIHIDGGDFVSG